MLMLIQRRIYQYMLCVFLSAVTLIPVSSFASVTMVGSRVIYPSDARSVDVQLKNNDAIPYVIQTWFDDGDANSQPQMKSDVPFISNPPVFRVQPKAGQVFRIIFNDTKKLPADRETMYWFNTLQIPPSNLAAGKSNAMLVMLRNRVKVFYRPVAIGKPTNILTGLQAEKVVDAKKGYGVKIKNPQPWYASLTQIVLSEGGRNIVIPADTISPFSEGTFWLPGSKKMITGEIEASVTAINDQGARVSEKIKIKF
ncbi:fimbria/pilus periplasmic chaperone [Erwiniaceae bacterium L1_54_6]|jgi:chaperone protein EcpD|nr:fimbria/pilus periplasmic chaperone [Erwiniaceae bacterium L1_54_6]